MEVASEVYVQLWKSFHTYDGSRPFRFWLHGIAVRLAHNHRRSLWRRFRLFDKQRRTMGADIPPAEDPADRLETKDELMRELRKLFPRLRSVVVLRYYHDYSLEEIAALLNIPVGTVKSRHHAALRQLRNAWTTNSETKVEEAHEYRSADPRILAAVRPDD